MESMRPGSLANDLDAYPGSPGTQGVVQSREPSAHPGLLLAKYDDNLLAREQSSGIDDLRYHEVLNMIDRP